MKQLTSPAFVVLLAIGALLVAGANQTMNARNLYQPNAGFIPDAADDGRFVMRYSPTLGLNVGLVVTIDGRVAGAITKGHLYKRYLPPGRHLIGVARNGRRYDALEMTLDVNPGQTYSYIAKYSVNQVLLFPARSSR